MKAVYDAFLSKTKEEKVPTIGTRHGSPITYSKDDFLTPRSVAAKLKEPVENVKAAMKKLQFNRAIFGLNGRKANVVVTLGSNHGIYLHPMALDILKEYLEKQKAKA